MKTRAHNDFLMKFSYLLMNYVNLHCARAPSWVAPIPFRSVRTRWAPEHFFPDGYEHADGVRIESRRLARTLSPINSSKEFTMLICV